MMSSPILTSIIIRSSITDTRPDRHPLAVNRISPDKRNALEVHNRARRSQNLQPLQWDQKLCDAAARWARHLATERKFHHSHDSGHGENLFWISSSSAPYLAAARDWIDEAKYYHGERIGEGDMASYGHYTQCMWHATTKVGMAAVGDSKGNVWVVARYFPPGNWTGEKPY